ncbi:MAG: dihydroneopterin aldolase [Bacteroidaceae bacterium]|nr:dihydroneopterin aldolase [Bacteroidaceae bacterium]
MNIHKSQVLIQDLRLFAHHGVLPQERTVGAFFIINLNITADLSLAMCTDELSATISYSAVFELVRAEMAKPSSLLEHVAYRICQSLLDHFPQAEEVELQLLKENPPMGAECTGAGVHVHVGR